MSSQIDLNGITVSYEQWGSGPELVLLHGGLSSGAVWEPLASRLRSRYRVIAPDSRGHGYSTRSGQGLSYGLLADDVADFIVALELAGPVVAGWSDGGQVALELAVRHAGVAGAVIVGGAHPDFVGVGLRERSAEILEILTDAGKELDELRALHADWDDLLEQTRPMWLDYDGLPAAAVSQISVPTLVLAGDRDEFVGLDHSISLYRMLATAELAVCPGAGHEAPMTEERADVFATMIDDFCRRVGAS